MSTEETRYIFTWRIKNLSLCTQKKSECLRSPIFKAERLYDSSWYIGLYPRGGRNSMEDMIGCSLHRCGKNDPHEIYCNLKIQILCAEGRTVFLKDLSYKFMKGTNWGWDNVLKTSWLLSNNSNCGDSIVVRCEITANLPKHKCPLLFEFLGKTKVDIDRFVFKWTVKNLNTNFLEVKQLPYNETSDFKIEVKVPDDDIKIVIHKVGGMTKSQSVSCRVSLLDVEGIKQDSKQAIHFFDVDENSSVGNDTWEFPTFLKRSKLNFEKEKYLKNDGFTLLFEMKFSRGSESHSIEYKKCTSLDCEEPPIKGPLDILGEDMKRLYISKTHADVKLQVDNKTVLAHKSILSIRSPVFSAMFDLQMTENKTGTVDIPDMDAGTVDSLLEYMYTGTVEGLNPEIAVKLLVAADKYQVLILKEKCANLLKSSLSDANVCDVLLVADLVQHGTLEDVCVSFIKDNSESVFFSDEWKLVIENNLQLAMRTVIQVSKLLVTGRKKR